MLNLVPTVAGIVEEKSKGYLPHRVVKAVVFWALAACIAIVTLAGILQAWESISDDLSGKLIWTAITLGGGATTFLIVNYLFGDLRELLGMSSEPPPSNDPAFRDRVQRAKADSPTSAEPSPKTTLADPRSPE